MTNAPVVSARQAFARVIQALQPYAGDIVVVGGWVHALLLASDNDSTAPIVTDDIDITIPRHLAAGTRPTLLDLAATAGFQRDPVSDLDGAAVRLIAYAQSGTIVDLDLLTAGNARFSHRLIVRETPFCADAEDPSIQDLYAAIGA